MPCVRVLNYKTCLNFLAVIFFLEENVNFLESDVSWVVFRISRTFDLCIREVESNTIGTKRGDSGIENA